MWVQLPPPSALPAPSCSPETRQGTLIPSSASTEAGTPHRLCRWILPSRREPPFEEASLSGSVYFVVPWITTFPPLSNVVGTDL